MVACRWGEIPGGYRQSMKLTHDGEEMMNAAYNKITIEIRTENAAFADDLMTEEVARILRALADRLEFRFESSKIVDVNGNACGSVRVE